MWGGGSKWFWVQCAALWLIASGAWAAVPVLGPERFIAQPTLGARPLETQRPGVGSSGQLALVAWVHRPNNLDGAIGAVGTNDGSAVLAARVSASGQVLDAPALTISELPERIDSRPVVGSDGSGFLVAWSALNGDIRAVRVGSTGAVQDTTPIVIGGAEAHARLFDKDAMAVAGAGGQYLVVWSAPSGLLYTRIGANGAVLDSPPVKLAGATLESQPRVAASGTQYVVTWKAETSLRAARISRGGTALDLGGFVIANSDAVRPDVASNGMDFFVVWNDGRADVVQGDVYGARVTAGGTVVDTAGLPIATGSRTQWNPRIAASGSGYFVAWEERFPPGTDPATVKGTRLSALGAVLDSPELTLKSNTYGPKPGTVALGSNYLAVWQDGSVSGARVDPAGRVLDDPVLQLSLGRADELYQKAASSDSTYVVLDDELRIATRLDARGAVLDRTGTVVTPDRLQTHVRFEGSGDGFLALWVGATDTTRTFGSNRIFRDGTLGGPVAEGYPAIAPDMFPPRIGLAGGPSGYIVPWCDLDAGMRDVHAFLVRPTGLPSPSGDAVIARVDGSSCEQVSVASNPDGYLVVFPDFDPADDTRHRIRGVRVRHDGTVLDATPLLLASGTTVVNETLLVSGATGEWLVVWQSRESGANPYPTYRNSAVRVRSDGTVPAAPLALSPTAPNLTAPAVASDGLAHVITWGDYRSADARGAFGVRVASGSSEPEPFTIATLPGYPDPYAYYTGLEISVASRAPGEFLVVYPRYVRESKSFQRVARRLDFGAAGPDAGLDGGDAGGDASAGTGGVASGTGETPPGTDGSVTGGGTPVSTGGSGSNAGGAPGSGGTSTAPPRTGGNAGVDGGTTPGRDPDDGCDCSTVGRNRPQTPPTLTVAFAAALVLLRRGRRESRLATSGRRPVITVPR